MTRNLKIIAFKSAHEWEKWLAKNHAASKGVWLKIFKKDSQTSSINYPEALEVTRPHSLYHYSSHTIGPTC